MVTILCVNCRLGSIVLEEPGVLCALAYSKSQGTGVLYHESRNVLNPDISGITVAPICTAQEAEPISLQRLRVQRPHGV